MTRSLDDPDLDDGDRTVLTNIRDHGIHIALVPPEGDTPGWAFSVGMPDAFGFPEVVVFGLPTEVGHTLLNEVASNLADGQPPTLDQPSPDYLEGHDVRFRNVDKCWHEWVLGLARWFHRGDDFDAVQLFWPAQSGALPWDPAFPSAAAPLQPLLFESDAARARMQPILDSFE